MFLFLNFHIISYLQQDTIILLFIYIYCVLIYLVSIKFDAHGKIGTRCDACIVFGVNAALDRAWWICSEPCFSLKRVTYSFFL